MILTKLQVGENLMLRLCVEISIQSERDIFLFVICQWKDSRYQKSNFNKIKNGIHKRTNKNKIITK